MSVVPIFERESAIIVGAGDAAYAHHTRETTIIGNIRATGVTVTIRNNYAARYNFAVRQYNNLPLSEEKTLMFGDLFLVHRYTVIFLWLLSMICGGISVVVKPLVTIPIIISLLYIVVSIYNSIIFKKNQTVFDDTLMIQNNDLGSNNEWYRVPIHTRIEDRAALAAVGGDNSSAMAAIREEYTNLKEVKVMVYTERYITRFTYFPAKTIAIHVVLFLIAFIFSIAMVAIRT